MAYMIAQDALVSKFIPALPDVDDKESDKEDGSETEGSEIAPINAPQNQFLLLTKIFILRIIRDLKTLCKYLRAGFLGLKC
jgi:hypothetical protein